MTAEYFYQVRKAQNDLLCRSGIDAIYAELAACSFDNERDLLIVFQRRADTINEEELNKNKRLAEDFQTFMGSLSLAKVLSLRAIDTIDPSSHKCCGLFDVGFRIDHDKKGYDYELFADIDKLSLDQLQTIDSITKDRRLANYNDLGLNEQGVLSTPLKTTHGWVI